MRSVAVSRFLLLYGILAVVAVFLGLSIADPMKIRNAGFIGVLFGVLLMPLVFRWHHFLLVISWHASLNAFFLPGRPTFWMFFAATGFAIIIFNRALEGRFRLPQYRPMALCLFIFGAVILGTALMRGGMGFQVLGDSVSGGKNYFYLLMAILGYFVLASEQVPLEKVRFYLTCFFLSLVTAIMTDLIYFAGPKFYFLYIMFPTAGASYHVISAATLQESVFRFTGLTSTGFALVCLLLLRFGAGGLLRWDRPWRLLMLMTATFICTFGGFRSAIILIGLLFGVMAVQERVWRTRYFLVLVTVGLIGLVVVATQLTRMPQAVQRSLSFLPVKVSPVVQQDAQQSLTWRLDMWRFMLPDVPNYLWLGKGYTTDPMDLYLAEEGVRRGIYRSFEPSIISGNYHNGPLSVLLPFGIPGTLIFAIFLGLGTTMCWKNYRYGIPELRSVNGFFLAYFIARALFFVGIYGSLSYDLFLFTGILGLMVAFNGGVASREDAERREAQAA